MAVLNYASRVYGTKGEGVEKNCCFVAEDFEAPAHKEEIRKGVIGFSV